MSEKLYFVKDKGIVSFVGPAEYKAKVCFMFQNTIWPDWQSPFSWEKRLSDEQKEQIKESGQDLQEVISRNINAIYQSCVQGLPLRISDEQDGQVWEGIKNSPDLGFEMICVEEEDFNSHLETESDKVYLNSKVTYKLAKETEDAEETAESVPQVSRVDLD
jgi:hypothetical protein